MTSPLATIGILSIGQMGLGIAKLLQSHNYRVITNISDRSPSTQTRALSANLTTVASDIDLVDHSDYILSIVPPRDAYKTATRITTALSSTPTPRQSKTPLYYLDLNAVSPQTALRISELFRDTTPDVRFIDGGIIGGPPIRDANPDLKSQDRISAPDERTASIASDITSAWKFRPGIPLSGPYSLTSAPKSGTHLATILNTRYLDTTIGSASGLKCCFASLSKGLTALALQSFSTASSLGVLPALQDYLDEYNPGTAEKARKGVTGCPSKAYRWVEEMRQIGECFGVSGGWGGQARVFREIAGVYEGLAEVVEREGMERLGSVEGVVGALGEGLKRDGGV